LDEYIVMSNHLHGIIVINDIPNNVGASLVGARISINRAGIKPAPTEGNNKTLGEIIGVFKSLTTNQYIQNVKNNNWPPFDKHLWQRGYYEHIVRGEKELDKIREYITNNPKNWAEDQNNIKN